MNYAVIIPMYSKSRKTITLCNDLYELGADNIIVVNDGCRMSDDYSNELTSIGCHIVNIKNNKGKGASLKAGFIYAYENLYNLKGFITVDADGQHKAEDVMKVARALDLRPDCLILGKRNFKKSKAPFNVRFGNRLSSVYFKVVTGTACGDCLTGLRGIPISLYEMAINTKGDRFDYEMNFLTKCADEKIQFYNVNITCEYSENSVSNYRLFKDTYLIYRTPLKFATASIGCTVIDLILFTFFTYLFPASLMWNVVFATLLARIVSGGLNFLINRKMIFKNNGQAKSQVWRFVILFLCIMIASTFLVSTLSFIPIPVTFMKAIIDLLLWMVNYSVQRKWVFKEIE